MTLSRHAELAQILPTPAHFEQASELVSAEQASEDVPCGPDPERQFEAIRAYAEAGFDELYIQQVGSEQERFFELYATEILPLLNEVDAQQVALAGARTRQ